MCRTYAVKTDKKNENAGISSCCSTTPMILSTRILNLLHVIMGGPTTMSAKCRSDCSTSLSTASPTAHTAAGNQAAQGQGFAMTVQDRLPYLKAASIKHTGRHGFQCCTLQMECTQHWWQVHFAFSQLEDASVLMVLSSVGIFFFQRANALPTWGVRAGSRWKQDNSFLTTSSLLWKHENYSYFMSNEILNQFCSVPISKCTSTSHSLQESLTC